jgi:hypothetical protein
VTDERPDELRDTAVVLVAGIALGIFAASVVFGAIVIVLDAVG